jgi:hypothetical protein
MKAFIFDPLCDALVTEDIAAEIRHSGLELFVKRDIAPLSECKELFEGNQERLLCLNPDYVSWKLPCSAYQDIPNLKAALPAFEWVSFRNLLNLACCEACMTESYIVEY